MVDDIQDSPQKNDEYRIVREKYKSNSIKLYTLKNIMKIIL